MPPGLHRVVGECGPDFLLTPQCHPTLTGLSLAMLTSTQTSLMASFLVRLLLSAPPTCGVSSPCWKLEVHSCGADRMALLPQPGPLTRKLDPATETEVALLVQAAPKGPA